MWPGRVVPILVCCPPSPAPGFHFASSSNSLLLCVLHLLPWDSAQTVSSLGKPFYHFKGSKSVSPPGSSSNIYFDRSQDSSYMNIFPHPDFLSILFFSFLSLSLPPLLSLFLSFTFKAGLFSIKLCVIITQGTSKNMYAQTLL